jgi:hypothetical protein
MKGIKRSIRTNGKVLGHRKGVNGEQLLSYLEARKLIYLPSYRWVLDNCLQDLLSELRQLEKKSDVILLDFTTNDDVYDLKGPLSHAGLIIRYLLDKWPE